MCTFYMYDVGVNTIRYLFFLLENTIFENKEVSCELRRIGVTLEKIQFFFSAKKKTSSLFYSLFLFYFIFGKNN